MIRRDECGKPEHLEPTVNFIHADKCKKLAAVMTIEEMKRYSEDFCNFLNNAEIEFLDPALQQWYLKTYHDNLEMLSQIENRRK